MLGSALRFLAVIVLALVIFWPEWGLLWLAIHNFTGFPILVTVLVLAVLIVVGVFLPISVRWFNTASTAAIVGMIGSSLYKLSTASPAVFNAVPFFMWIVLTGAVAVGWLLISTRLWRWAHGIVAVQQTDNGAGHHSD